MPPIATPTHDLAFFTDVEQFRSIALPILESDTTLNTLALAAVLSVSESKPGVVLGLLTNSSTSSRHVLVSPGFQGIGCQLYVAPAPADEDSAKLIAQQLPNLPCTTVSTTSAGAALLQHYCSWQAKHHMNVMLYKPEKSNSTCAAMAGVLSSAAAEPPHTAAAAGIGNTDRATEAAAAAAAAAAGLSAPSSTTPSLQLRSCSADSAADVQLVMQWAGEFLQEVFHLASVPAAPQLQAMVLPRLQQGLYYVLCNSAAAAAAAGPAAPVCMAGHVPTSSDSTRITMLYTPAAQRGRGYGRHAMRLLCSRLAGSGYQRICLMADQAEPVVNRLYKSVGFVAVGDAAMLERPEAPGMAPESN
uniref:N-acetyltransferase domain-containing protein n=1 Tax=Tetradesmus obliquus TaxID=3088 RepID=A0A383VFM6_TETOB|eukprot:jgi/Sobl393_1/15885/SZX63196.1